MPHSNRKQWKHKAARRGSNSSHFASSAPARDYGVLAIDPGATTGWCWLRSDGTFTTGTWLDWEAGLVALLRSVDEPVAVVVEGVCEVSYLPLGLQHLILRRATDVRLFIESLGCTPLMVPPEQWQRRMLRLAGPWTSTKEAARRACQYLSGKRVRTSHEADAMLLATYASKYVTDSTPDVLEKSLLRSCPNVERMVMVDKEAV